MRGTIANGKEIHAARVSRGLTQDELARLAGLDVKTVRKAELGKRIDVGPLVRLAGVLDTSVRSLTAYDDADAAIQARWRDVVLAMHRAFDGRDMESLLARYHEDAVLRLPGGPTIPFGGVFRGKAEIAKANAMAWAVVRDEPISVEEFTLMVSAEGVTLTGDRAVHMPNGELVRVPSVQVFTFAEDLVVEHVVQFDTLDFATRHPFSE